MKNALWNLNDIEKAFPSQTACMEYLKSLVWKDGIVSPFDPLSELNLRSTTIARNQETVFQGKLALRDCTGTIFDKSG